MLANGQTPRRDFGVFVPDRVAAEGHAGDPAARGRKCSEQGSIIHGPDRDIVLRAFHGPGRQERAVRREGNIMRGCLLLLDGADNAACRNVPDDQSGRVANAFRAVVRIGLALGFLPSR